MALAGSCVPAGLPPWSRLGGIEIYGGALDKRASETEGETPYSHYVYRIVQEARGSAYSTKPDTLVHCENLAIARTLSTAFFRMPEKARANATPGSSDERLPYWVEVLGVLTTPGESKHSIRKKCAAHYRAAEGPTLANVTAALQELLGDVFVAVHTQTGVDLATPPTLTKWPGINPGPTSFSLGGGAWFSERCHLVVEVQQPSGVTDSELQQLLNVQMFQLLDRMLPCWATFNWGILTDGDGFLLDISRMDFTGLT